MLLLKKLNITDFHKVVFNFTNAYLKENKFDKGR